MFHKIIFVFTSVILSLVAVAAMYLMSHYHATLEGAFRELEKETDGVVVPLRDETVALIIKEDGSVDIATNYILYPFGWYKDFRTEKTGLNVLDTDTKTEIAYTHAPDTDGLSFGLIEQENVTYALPKRSLQYPSMIDQEAVPVLPLAEYIDMPELQNTKLWYCFTMGEYSTLGELVFLDEKLAVVQTDKKAVLQK